jgi:hypothetical protein
MGNVKHGDDHALTQDSYRIMVSIKYDDDHTNAR